MKAAQITRYSKNIRMALNDIPVPEIGDDDILIRVKAAAVNQIGAAVAANAGPRVVGAAFTRKRKGNIS